MAWRQAHTSGGPNKEGEQSQGGFQGIQPRRWGSKGPESQDEQNRRACNTGHQQTAYPNGPQERARRPRNRNGPKQDEARRQESRETRLATPNHKPAKRMQKSRNRRIPM